MKKKTNVFTYMKCSTMAHFFQPLLPSFHTNLSIPVAFFSKHVQGRNKTAKLNSDASDKTWLVKMDGSKFAEGWEEFALAHDLRIGDILVFRHEGHMMFHVTVLGPSCCEIQYITSSSSSSDNNINDDNTDTQTNKRVKKNPSKKVVTSSDDSCFVAHVSVSSLTFDRLYIPAGFARLSGLDKMSGKKIDLVNEEGRSWTLNFRLNQLGMQTYIRPGWRSFCAENGMNIGDQCPFELVLESGQPILRMCRTGHRPKQETGSSSDQSCFAGTVTSSSLATDKLCLPREFASSNGLNKGCSEIILKNGWGGYWTLALRRYELSNYTVIKQGWTSFCQVNGMKPGDTFMFKLVETGTKPVLSLCPADQNRGETPLECLDGSDGVSLPSTSSKNDEY